MKNLVAIFMTVVGVLSLCAQVLVDPAKKLVVTPEKPCVEYGEKINLIVDYKIPAGDQPAYVFGYSFENTAPTALSQKIKPSGSSEIKLYSWKNLYQLQESDKTGSFKFAFDTAPLLPGDYQFGIGLRVSSENPATQKKYTLRTRFFLAITGPPEEHKLLQPFPDKFTTMQERKPALVQTLVETGNDKQYMYFKITCLEPEMEKLQLTLPRIWENDCLEVCLSPPGAESEFFYKLILNPNGRRNSYKLTDDNAGIVGNMVITSWEVEAKINITTEKDRWIAEVAIPFYSMEYQNPDQNKQQWKYAIHRGRRIDHKTSDFSTNSKAESTSDIKNFLPLNSSPEFNTRNFYWSLDTQNGIVLPENDSFVYQTTCNITNHTGEFRYIKVVAKLFQGKNEISESVQFNDFSDGYSKQIPIRLKVKTAGQYQLKIQIRGFDDSIYRQQTAELKLTPQLISVKILPPVIDNLIYDSMNCKKIKVRILDFTKTMQSVEIMLNGEGHKIPLLDSANEVELEIAELPVGEHVVCVRGNIGETSVTFRKLPPHPGETRLDENGITYVDGKPFIPFGWMTFPLPSAGGYMYDDNFNQTASFAQFFYSDWKAAKVLLDKAQRMNIKVGMYPYPQFNSKNKIFANRYGNLSAEQKKQLVDFVEKIKSHPALLGWYIADEPEGRNYNPEWFRQVRELINEIDPFHPCFMVNYQQVAVEKYHEGGNILLPDVYVHFYKDSLHPRYPINTISKFIHLCRKFKPAWMIVQAYACRRHDHPLCRAPNAVEFRNQVFQVFAADGKGVLLWAYPYSQMYHAMREMPRFVGAELKAIGPILLQPNQNELLQVSENGIIAALKQMDQHLCIIAVNTKAQEIQTQFKIKSSISKLYVFPENREIHLDKQEFSDVFQPYEVHVYLSKLPDNPDALSLKGIVEKIDKLDKMRFKPGNIVSIGEQTARDLILFRENGNPAEMPQLTASSEIDNYYHLPTGVLNYLIDGLIEEKPLCCNQYWRPQSDDKNPWLKVSLPKIAVIHEVILYTPEQRLEEAVLKIYKDEQITWEGIAKEKAGKLVFQFPPTEAKEILIEISKNNGQESFPLLTEIEVYGEYHEK